MRRRIEVFEDRDQALRRSAEEFRSLALSSVRARGRFDVALAGGSTPKGLYALLAREPFRARIPWSRTYFFWGDERHVPPDDSESNFRMAWESLLSKVTIPSGNVHRVPSEMRNVAEAAALYERVLRDHFGAKPRFDLVLLGLGPEGHTASLFPGSAALKERRRWVRENWVKKLHAWRITLSLPVINAAKNVVFLVAGEEKAAAVRGALTGSEMPAGRVRPSQGKLLWILDREAAVKFMEVAPTRRSSS